jgi:hypothetical protein
MLRILVLHESLLRLTVNKKKLFSSPDESTQNQQKSWISPSAIEKKKLMRKSISHSSIFFSLFSTPPIDQSINEKQAESPCC